MTIYYDYSAGRGNYDDGYGDNDYKKTTQNNVQANKSSKAVAIEWKPTPHLNKSNNDKKPSNLSSSINDKVAITRYSNSNSCNLQQKATQSSIRKKQINNKYNKFRYTPGNTNKPIIKSLSIGSKFVDFAKTDETIKDSSSTMQSDISKYNICTQETVNFAPSSPVFFSPVRIQGGNSLVIALKHEKYLKKKNFNKTFNSMSSQSLFSAKIITSSSVFELRPCNDISSL